jgi:hypothetical protein
MYTLEIAIANQTGQTLLHGKNDCEVLRAKKSCGREFSQGHPMAIQCIQIQPLTHRCPERKQKPVMISIVDDHLYLP